MRLRNEITLAITWDETVDVPGEETPDVGQAVAATVAAELSTLTGSTVRVQLVRSRSTALPEESAGSEPSNRDEPIATREMAVVEHQPGPGVDFTPPATSHFVPASDVEASLIRSTEQAREIAKGTRKPARSVTRRRRSE